MVGYFHQQEVPTVTKDQKIEAIKTANQNARDNGYDPDLMSSEELAVDLWMDADCEKIEFEERLEIVKFLRNEG